MDIFAGEKGASVYHTTRGCKVNASLAVVVRYGVRVVPPDHRSVSPPVLPVRSCRRYYSSEKGNSKL